MSCKHITKETINCILFKKNVKNEIKLQHP